MASNHPTPTAAAAEVGHVTSTTVSYHTCSSRAGDAPFDSGSIFWLKQIRLTGSSSQYRWNTVLFHKSFVGHRSRGVVDRVAVSVFF